MRKTLGFIVEYEKDDRVQMVIVAAASPEQALEIAKREMDTDIATVIAAAPIIFAD